MVYLGKERCKPMKNVAKPVYVYDLEGKLVKEFETTAECAEFFDKEREYINHHLKYYKKIRKDEKWYKMSREKLEK